MTTGSSVNLNVQFDTVVLDGVFTRDDQQRVSFHAAPPPTSDELGQLVRRVRRRAMAWLTRRGLLAETLDAGTSQETAPQTALDACARLAMQRGSVAALQDVADHAADPVATAPKAPRNEGTVEHAGFNVHASVAIAADDDLGREGLCRYGARPPLALERLRRLPDGRVAFRIKKLRGGRAKHRIMTPLEFLARYAALVPPPRYPLVRYHGVIAPRSAWRRHVVPRRPSSSACVAAKARQADRVDWAIVVDGTPHEVETTKGTYAEVVTFAYPEYPKHPEVTYSVTYKDGPHENPEGILPPGGSVFVKNEMRFHVSPTGQSARSSRS